MSHILYLDNLTLQDLQKIQEVLQRPALEAYLEQFTEGDEREIVLINKLDYAWLSNYSKALLDFSTTSIFSESEIRFRKTKKPTFTEEGAIRGLRYLFEKAVEKRVL